MQIARPTRHPNSPRQMATELCRKTKHLSLQFNVTDPDDDNLTYSILYGDDAEFFELNDSSGALSFVTARTMKMRRTIILTIFMNL